MKYNLQKTIRFTSLSYLMKYPGLLLIGLFSNMLWLSPLWAVSCPTSLPAVEVSVKFVKATPNVNNQATQRRLSRKSGRKKDGSMTLGLTQSGLYIKVLSTFSVRSSKGDDKSCVNLQGVQVEYGFKKTAVLIDKHYRPGSCEYDVIYKHEFQHVYIMNSKGKSYYPWIKHELAKRVAHIKQRISKRPRRTQRKMSAQVKKVAQGLVKQMNNSLSAAHGVIDTPENYRRTQELCSNW
ncbi:MAG: hypothetical protein HQL68_07995 [Magnetococcales bacterium]|nr:hypothetical protein [Magnetococcales bacterium]